MCQRALHRFANVDVSTVRAARHVATAVIRDAIVDAPTELVEDAELVADELVANAVRAGARSIEMVLELHYDRIEVAVTDDANGWPMPRQPDVRAMSGRGLQIVEALTTSWGVTREADKRTTVWAHLQCDPSYTTELTCSAR
jgi:anti-sigma regulatory factor (Ser/Thr protein kinase)